MWYNSKKMSSVWWVNGTDPLRPRFWHYDVFYEFLRATIFMWSCREKIGLQNCHLGFSKFWFFKTENFEIKIWNFENLNFLIPFRFSKPRLTYARSLENCETQTWDQLYEFLFEKKLYKTSITRLYSTRYESWHLMTWRWPDLCSSTFTCLQ